MLVTMAVGTGIGLKRENAVVLLRGVDTTKLTEDSPPAAFRLQPIRGSVDKYPITGTYRYKSTGGVTRTVFVADAKKAEEEQAAEEDRREEAERNGIEAERESKRKAQAEREAKEKKARAETEAKEKVEMERKAKAEKARWREWTVSGYADKTKFEARFDSLANGTVRLTKHGGETVRVALEDLSADDQAWIRRRYEQRDRSP
jgi:flagellar biosynthesis GTPase FlhF